MVVVVLLLCHQDGAEEAEPTGVDMLDLSGLTDDELRASLAKHGVRAGPILG